MKNQQVDIKKYIEHIKEWINAICSNMDENKNYHTEWSKSEKDKYCIISHKLTLKIMQMNLYYKIEIESQM